MKYSEYICSARPLISVQQRSLIIHMICILLHNNEDDDDNKESLGSVRIFFSRCRRCWIWSFLLSFYSPCCQYLTVSLFLIVSMTTPWVRPTQWPTSAAIPSPKSWVIALICIPQLNILAHS